MMFYTQLFTSKRGPLAKIWLAAHWERKLTKTHVFECNLETTIRDIIFPKMKIGLRTSGHLLIGVVRIYSKKANYLLADCNEALVKIRTAFRPGLTDMPTYGREATIKAITLIEDFTAFDTQLPALSNIDVDEHFSLNQSRTEEITLKEDFGSGFLNVVDFGDESQSHKSGLLDISFQSLAQQEDAFGDEDQGFNLLDFLANSSEPAESTGLLAENHENENPETSTLNDQPDADRMQVETPSMNKTSLLSNEELAFALEPVPITPNSERKKGKRKRKLIVDETKELRSELIRQQLLDYSDLVGPMDMAPPTKQLMQWKESGGVDKLLSKPCSSMIASQIKELFSKRMLHVRNLSVYEEVEMMRQDGREGQRDVSSLGTDNASVVRISMDHEQTGNTELTGLAHMNDSECESHSRHAEIQGGFEFTQPELPSEHSMFVHPSFMETSLNTQMCPALLAEIRSLCNLQSMLDSQDFEEKKITKQAQKLLSTLKNQSNSDTRFSLQALCEGVPRWKAATTFFCFLVLVKQKALYLQQSAPYEDIIATPGSKFYDL